METNPLRGLFGVSSPQPEEQRVAPQPTAPTETVCFEIPSGMIEKLLDNPFTGDEILHPNLYLIYVDEVCGLFKLAGIPEDVIKRKVFPLSLKGKALTWHYCRMLLTRHYDQRPFDESVCDALITNGALIKLSKNMQNICDGGDIKHGSE